MLATLHKPRPLGDYDNFGQLRADTLDAPRADENAITPRTSAERSRRARAAFDRARQAETEPARSPSADRLAAMGFERPSGADGARTRLAERRAAEATLSDVDPTSAETALENPHLAAQLAKLGITPKQFRKHGRHALATLRERGGR